MKIQKALILFLILIMFVGNVQVITANPAAPPSLTIVVTGAPADLKISFGPQQGKRTDKLIESQFVFYYSNPSRNYLTMPFSDYPLTVSTSGQILQIAAPVMTSYESFYVLDLKNRTLTPVDPTLKKIESTALRVLLTLVLEGIIFYLFGFRKKRSWLLFVLINLFTQIGLNIWLNVLYGHTWGGFSPNVLIALIVGEVLVMIVELLCFAFLVKEYSRRRTLLFVVSANLFSLGVGYLFITNFPV